MLFITYLVISRFLVKKYQIFLFRRKSNLRITCLKEEDAGIYECRPSSIMGQGSSTKARVTVTKSPRMSLRPGNGK